jgi:hypothetical protein
MALKNKAAVVVSGALTVGAFATLAGALPAGAATYGTEQSGAGNVFGVGSHSAIVGASTNAQNIAFTRSVQGHTVEFKFGRNGCVTDNPGGLSLQNCDGHADQKFTEVGSGPSVALQNQASHNYVQDNGRNHQVTTVRVRPDRRGHLNFSRSQLWKWVDINPGRGSGGGGRGGQTPPAPTQHGSWKATTKLSDRPDGGNGGDWADDYMTRVATIKLVGNETTLSDCGAGATHCYAYTGTLSDKGTFVTIPHSLAPNQSTPGVTEKSPAAHGTINGNATLTFYASSDHPNASGVPSNVNNHNTTPSGEGTTTNWVEQFFPNGTTFGGGPALTTWSWSYATTGLHPQQHWIDALNNGDGNLPADGNITG